MFYSIFKNAWDNKNFGAFEQKFPRVIQMLTLFIDRVLG